MKHFNWIMSKYYGIVKYCEDNAQSVQIRANKLISVLCHFDWCGLLLKLMPKFGGVVWGRKKKESFATPDFHQY